MSPMMISFAVLAMVVVLFVWNRIPVGIVAIGASLTLYATGVLELEQVLAGFGEPTVIFIATLFVVSEGLDAAGVTTWAGQKLIARAGQSSTRLLLLTMLPVAFLTALISVNGAVAALLPVAVVMATRLGRPPSQLLMPLVFAAHAGSLLALTGTPVNVIVSDAAADVGPRGFAFLEFALLGVPLLLGTLAIVLLFGHRLLPQRTARAVPADFSEHARMLVRQYQLDHDVTGPLLTRELGVAEIVVPPRSGLVGMQVYPGMVTPSGDLVVLAVQRKGTDQGPGETVLAVGDALLLQGTWAALDENLEAPSVLVVNPPELVRRQAVPMGARAWEAIGVLVAMVVLLASGAVPAVVAGLLAACAMVLLKVLTVEQAYRSISWTTVVLVGAMIPLSTAMFETGAAEKVAHALVSVVGPAGPYALLVGLFLLTACLGQLISNMATALIVIPVAVLAAAETGVSARPLLMTVTVAAAASFLTPVATPVNMMVMGPGGYRFGDYWKLGLPLLLLFLGVSTLLIPILWPF